MDTEETKIWDYKKINNLNTKNENRKIKKVKNKNNQNFNNQLKGKNKIINNRKKLNLNLKQTKQKNHKTLSFKLNFKKENSVNSSVNKDNQGQNSKTLLNNKKGLIKRKLNKNKINNNKFISNNLSKLQKSFKNKNINLKKAIFKKSQKRDNNLIKVNILNDSEMNSLNYEEAISKDYRTYCQYYISLLRTKHILIFSFYPTRDYNSQIIKIYIFFLTFTINYVVSAMFYSESTMHKIYIDKGSFDITYQLPQMCYSFIISTILNGALNVLGLYEQNLISFKNDKKNNINMKNILSNILCKMIFFFIITFILIFLFWIYLGCFCAVYKNTQLHLFIDVLSSFVISFISPFFINLLPGIFRIKSLKNKRPYMFKFSKILQLL